MTSVRRMARLGHCTLIVPLLLTGQVRTACAGLTGGAGFDYQSGPDGLTWSAPLVFGVASGKEADAAIALYRYHSSDTGWGWSGLMNLGVAFTSGVGGRLIGTQAIGDQDYRAWRLQAGPTFRLPENRSLFAYVAHYEDSDEARLTQIGGEAGFPLSPSVSGLAGGALGKWQGDISNAQGVLGLTWSARTSLQVFGQAMFGKNIASASTLTSGAASGPFGTRGHGRATASGSGDTTTSSTDWVGFVGIRIFVP
jgi:hypothetical protein